MCGLISFMKRKKFALTSTSNYNFRESNQEVKRKDYQQNKDNHKRLHKHYGVYVQDKAAT